GLDFRRVPIAEAFDITTLSKISIPDSIRKYIAGGFTFAGNHRLIGVNPGDFKKSAMVEFPSGKLISEFPVRGHLDSPTRGNYLLVRPIKDHALGVMEMNNKTIFKSSDRAALDIFDDLFV